jgi:hypothetical protein
MGPFHAESLHRAEHVTQVKSELGGNYKEAAMVYSKALLRSPNISLLHYG